MGWLHTAHSCAHTEPPVGQSHDTPASDWMRPAPRPALAGLRGWVEAVTEAGLGCVGLTCDLVVMSGDCVAVC